jgi:hypothetical protein
MINLLLVALVSKVLQPDFGYHYNMSITTTGVSRFVYDLLGWGVIAELPRTIVLLAANVGLWYIISGLLNRFANLERRRVQDLVIESSEFSPAERATVPTGR